MITTQATFNFHTKCQKAKKERENSTKVILVALERKITKGALQEYHGLLSSDFLAQFCHDFKR